METDQALYLSWEWDGLVEAQWPGHWEMLEQGEECSRIRDQCLALLGVWMR